MADLRALPKAHLHVHLENSVRWSTLRELGDANGLEFPRHLSDGRYSFASFSDFFDQNALVRSCLRRPDDFRRIALEFCEDEAAEGTRYAEVSFTAAAHGRRLNDLAMPLAAVLEGLDEGRIRFGISSGVILDHSRRRPVEQALVTVDLAEHYHDAGVVAVGLAGDESYPLGPFSDVFLEARRRGIHVVHHAGEAAGPESIRQAIDLGCAQRIGHGIRCLEDPSLVQDLVDRRIALEVCPTSNVALGFAPSLPEHPFARLVASGLAVTINTDIPAMIATSLSAEYRNVQRTFHYDHTAMATFAMTSFEASFAPKLLKESCQAEIAGWL